MPRSTAPSGCGPLLLFDGIPQKTNHKEFLAHLFTGSPRRGSRIRRFELNYKSGPERGAPAMVGSNLGGPYGTLRAGSLKTLARTKETVDIIGTRARRAAHPTRR